MWKRLRDEVGAGHQAYVVCPLVDEKGKIEAKAATVEFERLRRRRARRTPPRATARPAALEGERGRDGRIPGPSARRAGGHDRDRGRRRRPQRHGDDRRGRRPFRSVAAPPAPRPGRPRRGPVVVLPRRRSDDLRRRSTHGRDRATSVDGFLLAEKDLEIRGAGEVFGRANSRGSTTSSSVVSPATSRSSSRRAAPPSRSSTTTPTSPSTRSSAKRSRICSATRSSSCSRADGTMPPGPESG